MSAEPPASARARMAAARSGGTWGSALTADEFAAIRGVGFEPVGQVFGAAVYGTGADSGYGCPAAPGASGGPPPGPLTQLSGPGAAGSFGPLVAAMDQARLAAVGRMIAECAALGAHGVVGVHVSRGTFLLGGQQFTVIGTAVRARAAAPAAPPPFCCDLSGQDFAKLIRAAWVPVGLVLGLSVGARHDDRDTTRQARWGSANAEVAGWTDLVRQARRDARSQLERDVTRLGAEGAVTAAMGLRVRQRDCPATVGRRDHIAEASFIGTAVARFSRAAQERGGPPLAVMSLDPQRRQAARARPGPGARMTRPG